MNLIPDLNLRKMWNAIRSKHMKHAQRLKMDSDSVFENMRSQTEMKALPVRAKKSLSFNYKRNADGTHSVLYENPRRTERIRPYKPTVHNTNWKQLLFPELVCTAPASPRVSATTTSTQKTI
jgi:hypothetical protein